MYINVTKTLVRVTFNELRNTRLSELFKSELQKLHLQYGKRLLDDELFVTGGREKVVLIGRDCFLVEERAPVVLAQFREEIVRRIGKEDSFYTRSLDNLIGLWKKWTKAAAHIWAMAPTDDHVKLCEVECKDFFRHLVTHYDASYVTWYIHFMAEHLPEATKLLHDEFKIGYGIMTTQSMEHLHKWLKRRLQHTLRNRHMWMLAFRHVLQMRSAWYREVFKLPIKLRRCSACH
jgi:hypothetical protein